MHGNSFIISFPFFLSREPLGSIGRNDSTAPLAAFPTMVVYENLKEFWVDIADADEIRNIRYVAV